MLQLYKHLEYIMKIQVFWDVVPCLWANRVKPGLYGTCGNTPIA